MAKTPRAVRVAVSLGIVGLATGVLIYLKLTTAGLHHPIFVYLPLIALLALAFGSAAALSGAAAAIAASAYFLYDPAYSFTVANMLEVGDLLWFALLAVIVVKCTRALSRRSDKLPQAKSRYGWS
jgi:two-component system, OmpR family, sensor histidine kinase KdpD